VCTACWLEHLKERDHFEANVYVSGNNVKILDKLVVKMFTVFNWFRVEFSDKRL
jgi:hypothetical protein